VSILSGELHPSFRRRLGRGSLLALVFLAAILSATSSRAPDNYEIQVYGAELVNPGHTKVELHSNFTMDGSKTIVDGVFPTNHAEHETVEITHGFTDYFECGFDIFTSVTQGQGWQWVGDHIRPRFAAPEKWHGPVMHVLSVEGAVERRVQGPIPSTDFLVQGVVFSPNFKFSDDFTPKIAGGLVYYGSVGPVTGFDAFAQQQHQIFPAIDLNIAPQCEINFGLGVGLMGATTSLPK
jgi:hypothetical protein